MVRMTNIGKECSVDGCDRSARSLGWCCSHYARWYKNGRGKPPEGVIGGIYINVGKICSIDGCDISAQSKGWCSIHYSRWFRRGDPLAPPQKSAILRKTKIKNDVCVVSISDGSEALADAEDRDVVEAYNWTVITSPNGKREYIVTNIMLGHGQKKTGYLHRMIMSKYTTGIDDVMPGKKRPKWVVDHINGNCRDNRKENLRVVSPSVNLLNRKHLNRDNKSGYHGVCWHKEDKKWRTDIKHENHYWSKGFDDPAEAAKARDAKLVEMYMEDIIPSSLNFPDKFEDYLAQTTYKQT